MTEDTLEEKYADLLERVTWLENKFSMFGRAAGMKRPRQMIGPGAQLEAIFRLLSIGGCAACHALAAKMNKWGVAKCRERIDEIIADIRDRYKETKWSERYDAGKAAWKTGIAKEMGVTSINWRLDPIPGLVTLAIDRAEKAEVEHKAKMEKARAAQAAKQQKTVSPAQ